MLRTSIGSVDLECCIYNASGPRSGTIEALGKVGNSVSGAILSKSVTLEKQSGNELPRSINKIGLGHYCDGAINSEGLPNQGISYYISDEAGTMLNAFDKPYIISLSGFTLEDNLLMIDQITTSSIRVAAIEVNLACPNIPGKPIVCYDFGQLDLVLSELYGRSGLCDIPIGVKLAPYMDMMHFHRTAEILAKYPVRFIVCCNTMGNGLAVNADNECEGFAACSGLGGLSGGFLKHTALANVRLMYQLLAALDRPDIDIVGVGGVCTGRDAFELILCGARAVQVGTMHWTEGPACFDRIARELEQIMKSKNYTSIEDFRGKLKPFARGGSSSDVAGEPVGKPLATVEEENETLVNSSDTLHLSLPVQALVGLIFLVLFLLVTYGSARAYVFYGL